MNTTTRQSNFSPSSDHPNPVDRNRSILWARYLVDSLDWVIVSTKETLDSDGSSMISISVIDSSGSVAYESIIKPDGIVSNETIAEHQLETATLFNAQPYAVIRESLIQLISGKDVLSWDFGKQRSLFEKLDGKYSMPPHEWRGNSVSHQYARFIGEKDGNEPGYLMPELIVKGQSARAENQAVREIVKEIAASSQYSDPLASGKPGWTAEFYRPKLSTGEKLKNLFSKK